jgi:hypothetical protein
MDPAFCFENSEPEVGHIAVHLGIKPGASTSEQPELRAELRMHGSKERPAGIESRSIPKQSVERDQELYQCPDSAGLFADAVEDGIAERREELRHADHGGDPGLLHAG